MIANATIGELLSKGNFFIIIIIPMKEEEEWVRLLIRALNLERVWEAWTCGTLSFYLKSG